MKSLTGFSEEIEMSDKEMAGSFTNWVDANGSVPETQREVFALMKYPNGRRTMFVARYFHRWQEETDGDYEGCHEYHEERDAFFVEQGWYEQIKNWDEYSGVRVCEGVVTHWMPLPEPPQEASDDLPAD